MSACAFLIGCTLHVCDSVCVYVFLCVSRSVCSVLPGVKWGVGVHLAGTEAGRGAE